LKIKKEESVFDDSFFKSPETNLGKNWLDIINNTNKQTITQKEKKDITIKIPITNPINIQDKNISSKINNNLNKINLKETIILNKSAINNKKNIGGLKKGFFNEQNNNNKKIKKHINIEKIEEDNKNKK